MAVFVDPNFEWPRSKAWPYGSVSHMYADSPEELHQMARRIGLKRVWCSDFTQPGSRLLHYDLSPKKRSRAIEAGAQAVDHQHGRGYYRSLEERKEEIANPPRRSRPARRPRIR